MRRVVFPVTGFGSIIVVVQKLVQKPVFEIPEVDTELYKRIGCNLISLNQRAVAFSEKLIVDSGTDVQHFVWSIAQSGADVGEPKRTAVLQWRKRHVRLGVIFS
ncbi:hypothetical protein D3C80_992200 [compost metagenome]